jgi:tripartite-type tricarboxylate transporter receptor subunit TctC
MMKINFPFVRVVACAACFAAVAGLSADALAQARGTRDGGAYPSRAIRLLVGFAPGGGSDLAARLIGQKMGEDLQQQFVVDNRGGGGGTIATNLVAKAAPDGHTLLLMSIGIAFAPALYRSLPYDLEKDLLPVVLLVTQPCILALHPGVAATSVRELIALARARPGEIRYNSSGIGSAAHLAGELFRATANVELVHVPYKGGASIVTALLGGEVHMLIAGAVSLLPHVRAGKLRGLASTGLTRARDAPEMPTIAEAGLPGAEFDIWYGLFLPAATPRATAQTLNASFNRIVAAPDVQARLAAAGFETLGGTPEKFAGYLKSELRKWSGVVRSAGIPPE